MTGKTCSRTGLHLIKADGQAGFRVTQDRYHPLSAMANKYVGPLPTPEPGTALVDRRGRYDTVGCTVYAGDSEMCAYAEVLGVFRKKLAAVAAAAESIGWKVDEYVNKVLEDAKLNGVEPPWAIPAAWQMDRSIHELSLPSKGWWVRIDHRDTLTALERLTSAVAVQGMAEELQLLTIGSITGENRALTTLLAQTLRMQTLEDGSEPLGISFESKTLFGRCWAFWDRREDLGLPPGSNDPQVVTSGGIGTDPHFAFVADYYRLPRPSR